MGKNTDKSNVITIVGSMKFWDRIIEEGARLHKNGNIVLLSFKDPKNSDEISDEQKRIYDDLIRQMIDMSDEVFVVNPEGYIGSSVKSEIKYAVEHHKSIQYLEFPRKIITLCGSRRFKSKFDEVFISLTKIGHIVFTPAIFELSNDQVMYADEILMKNLDYIHQRKIDMSDEILIMNVNGYIGGDTKKEIEYAESVGKDIIYYER